MSGIELEPLGDIDIGCIAVPVGKTVIGRGPFLQVQDKRVSRNHGILEVENGELYLTPTHSNPCFFKKNGVGVPIPLPKDQKKCLQDGDVFGLLPDKLFFKANTSKLPNGSAKGIKEDSDNTDKADEKEPDDVKSSPKKGVVRPPGGKDMTMPLDKNRVLPTWMVQVAKVTTTSPVKASPPKPTSKKTPAAKKTKIESASEEELEEEEEVPANKKGRGRPKVQTNTKSPRKPTIKSYDESEEEEEEDEDDYVPVKKSEKTKKPARNTPKKKGKESSEDDDSDEDYGRKPKKTNSNKRGAKRKQSESEYSEEESEEERKPRRRGRRQDSDDEPSTSRPSRSAAKKRGSYVDDFVGAEELSDSEEISDEAKGDSDFILSEDDSGSDWEASRKKQQPKKTWKPKKPPRGRGRRGRPKKGSDDEDSDEEYVPRASQRKASRAATKRFREIDSDEDSEEEYVPRGRTQRGRPGRGRVKRKSYDSEEESSSEERRSPKKRGRKAKKDDSDESDSNKKSKPLKRGAASRKSKYDESEEEEEEEEGKISKPASKKVKKDSESDDDKKDSGKKKSKDESEDEEEKEKKPKKRKRCMFGKKCYRKNPVHFSDYCHPGDATYDEADSDADDDLLGLGKKFQKMREAATKTKKKTTVVDRDEDDDGLPNTYDYKDSFIDDEDVSDDESEPGDDSGSDYVPEDSENIRSLKREAKGFVKNKKMHKPAHAK